MAAPPAAAAAPRDAPWRSGLSLLMGQPVSWADAHGRAPTPTLRDVSTSMQGARRVRRSTVARPARPTSLAPGQRRSHDDRPAAMTEYLLWRHALDDGETTTVYAVRHPLAGSRVRVVFFPRPQRLDVWCSRSAV